MKYAFAALLLLAACGADGDPVRPEYTGTVTMGSDGLRGSGGVAVRRGPVTLGVGF